MKKLFKRSAAPALSDRLAERMLEHIFDACQVQPNTIPLKTLISYSNYRRERFSFQKSLLVAILLLFCLLPPYPHPRNSEQPSLKPLEILQRLGAGRISEDFRCKASLLMHPEGW